MTTTPTINEFDGLKPLDALCIADTEDLAMEVAAWLYDYAGGRRAFFPARLLRIIDATDHPVIRGYLIFWPDVSDRANWYSRGYQRQAIARQFEGQGLRRPSNQVAH